MRIVDNYSLGHLKCTLFINDGRYTLKVEDEYGAISYKLKELESTSLKDIQDYLSVAHIKNEIISSFRSMRKGRDGLLDLLKDEDIIEEII